MKSLSLLGTIVAATIFICKIGYAQIKVVNMIPREQSNETNNDAEPNLAVNPAKPWFIAGSAFTPDPMKGMYAPIFVSFNGGNTWGLNSIVSGGNPGNVDFPLLDITIRFAGSGLQLYGASLRGDFTAGHPRFPVLEVWRTPDFMGDKGLVQMMSTRDNVDQPYIQVTTVMGGPESKRDKVYVPNNNNLHPTVGNNSTVDIFEYGQTAGVPFSDLVDKRPSPNDRRANEQSVRTAIHPSGVVYTAFYKIREWGVPGSTPDKVDIIVVRDDNWANGTSPFQALTDPSDLKFGRIVQPNKFIIYGGRLGPNRLTASSLSIAVDPNNSAVVYLCWADTVGSLNTLHVWKTTNSGDTWVETKLPGVLLALNPALAVNIKGKVGFMYQQMTGQGNDRMWETHLQRSVDGGDTWDDVILSRAKWNCLLDPMTCPVQGGQGVYLGDYIHLTAVGKDFYGIFSASNHPDRNNFPKGVIYQRNADFQNVKLFKGDGVTQIRASIDPFFVHVQETDSLEDFYVRDYSIDLENFDIGIEPSTEPLFFRTSDVWNRHTNSPGTFTPENQPEDEPALSSMLGTNFIFTRVHRKMPGEAKDVNLDFYSSEFGTGSNYEFIGTQTLSFPANQGSVNSPGLPWSLSVNTSTHACIAVEISTPEDPILSPSLLNKTPGWYTGTDLMVINDNNKAQKNLQVINMPLTAQPMPLPPPGDPSTNEINSVSAYAVIHNPGLKVENLNIRWYVDSALKSKLYPILSVPGNSGRNIVGKQGMTFYEMQPGESRFLKIDYRIVDGKEREVNEVLFNQIRNEIVVNGFSVQQAFLPMEKAIKQYAEMEVSVFGRAQRLYPKLDSAGFKELQLSLVPDQEMSRANYTNRLSKSLSLFKSIANHLRSISEGDPFGLTDAINQVDQSLKANNLRSIAISHLSLINTLDACLTMLQFNKGNSADILQTIYLQRQIMDELKNKNDQSKKLRDLSSEFIIRFEKREIDINSYSSQVGQMLPILKTISSSNEELKLLVTNIEKNISDPVSLQGAHIKYLLKLRGKN